MTTEIKVSPRTTGKRKRIPVNPGLKQGYSIKKEVTMSGDLNPKRYDDIDFDLIYNIFIKASRDAYLMKNIPPQVSGI